MIFPFPFKIPWKLLVGLVVVGAIGLTIYLAFQNYENLIAQNGEFRSQLGLQKGEMQELETGINTQRQTINAQSQMLNEWTVSLQEFEKNLEVIANEQAAARSERDDLQGLFAEHDFENLVQARPETLQRLINNGTARVFLMLKCASAGDNGSGDSECAGLFAAPTIITNSAETGPD